MDSTKQDVERILKQVQETLRTAQYGYEDFVGDDVTKRMSGLRNFIVFGRSVTYALQNLKTPLGDLFNKWYAVQQAEMSANPVCKHMNTMRNEILKEGKLGVETYTKLQGSVPQLGDLPPGPPGATSFFAGDELGGSGWLVPQPDGSIAKYYTKLDLGNVEVGQVFTNANNVVDVEGKPMTVQAACKAYLDILERVTHAAAEEFLGRAQSKGKRHLWIVR